MNPNFVQTCFLVLFEALAYLIVFISSFAQRTRHMYVSWLATLILLWVADTSITLYVDNSVLTGLLIVAVNLIISMISFKVITFVRFYMVTFVYVLIVTVDVFFYYGYSYLRDDMNLGYWSDMIAPFIPKILVILILLALKKCLFTERITHIKNKTSAVFSAVLMVVNVFNVIDLAEHSSEGHVTILSTASLVIIDLLLYYFMRQSYRQASEEYASDLLKKQVDFQSTHIEELSALYNKQNLFMHDYRNQVAAVKQLLLEENYAEATKYLCNLSSDLIQQHYKYHTGHNLVDAILHIKDSEASNFSIRFVVFTNNLSNVQVRDTHLVSLLTNLLDNAIEAAAKCEMSIRAIEVKIHGGNNELVIAIKNSAVARPDFLGRRPIASKTDREFHGIGFLSITSVLEKYSADYEIFATDDSFQFVTVINYPSL